jgi:hypothetical protein
MRNRIQEPSILHLTLHREWFAKIADGTKREEYRDITTYWQKRLSGRSYDYVCFRNGYARTAPTMMVEFLGIEKRHDCYAILLGAILKIERW